MVMYEEPKLRTKLRQVMYDFQAYSHYMPMRTYMQSKSLMASPYVAHACGHACRWFCQTSGEVHAHINVFSFE